jgi:hypothetical protein
MPPRQQRRANLARPVVNVGLQPIIYPIVALTRDPSGGLLVTVSADLVVRPAPEGPTVDGHPPILATYLGTGNVLYSYSSPVEIGSTVAYADWNNAIRGANGEYVGPIVSTIEPNLPPLSTQPAIVFINVLGSNSIDVSIDRPCELMGDLGITCMPAGPVSMFSISPDGLVLNINFAGFISSGDSLTVASNCGVKLLGSDLPLGPGTFRLF